MREILFRGKKIDNGQWTYGLPTYDMEYVFGENDFDSPDSYMVDVNTIGQYTGLKDKNGAEDIKKIKHYCDLILKLEYNE